MNASSHAGRLPKRKTPAGANRQGQESNSDKTLPFQYGKCKECFARVFEKPLPHAEGLRRFKFIRRILAGEVTR